MPSTTFNKQKYTFLNIHSDKTGKKPILLLALIRSLDRLINWNAMKKWIRREFQAGSKTTTYSTFR